MSSGVKEEVPAAPRLPSLWFWESGSEPWSASGSFFKGATGACPGHRALLAHFPRGTHLWFPPSGDLVGSEPELPEING